MQAAGRGVGRHLLQDMAIANLDPAAPAKLLVLVGKGHNGGDALLAAIEFLRATPWQVEVGFVFGQNRLRPLALAAWRELQQAGGSDRVRAVRREAVEATDYAIVLDGVFGFQFRPPVATEAVSWFAAAQRCNPRLRAAVDLPSGLDQTGAFAADFTYATGILKSPLLGLRHAGRLRYIDLGFFERETEGTDRVVTPAILAPLRRLRPVNSDKRTYGRLAVIGGSRSYPGAVAMAVAAALHSGAGNVSAFVPASIAPALAAQWPEAMWMGCPETEDGNLAIDAGITIKQRLDRAAALLVGPGLGHEPETHALLADVLGTSSLPRVIDADALQPELFQAGRAARILTPHAGELQRIGGVDTGAVVVQKGPRTIVHAAGHRYHVIEGGPELARGGSGDLLAGLIGGLLATDPAASALAAVQGAFWHGRAAQCMAQRWGETAVRNTSLLAELNGALRA